MSNVTSEYTLPDNFTSTEISHQEAIETVIYSLQENDSAMVHHDDQGFLWKFKYGSVEIYVQLTGETEDDLLTVWSPVLTLPATDELGLMRKLLEMNGEETLETRFGIMNNQIVLLSQRTVADLSPGEISRAITLVATIADDNDEKLIDTYGGNPISKN
ncbi:MAG: YbjN domain-containing protein [Crocosphaera sp.]